MSFSKKELNLACIVLSLLIAVPVVCLAENSVLILKSNDNRFFNTTIEKLIDKTRAEAKYTIRSLESFKNASLSDIQPQLIITLGHEAARYTNHYGGTIPIIHSYLTKFQHDHHKYDTNHSNVLLDQPLERYALFIKQLLSVQTVGIIKPTGDEIDTQSLQKLNKKLNLEIEQSLFKKDDNPVRAVRSVLKNNEVLLTLPAPEIYNRRSMKGILLASYRLKKPVISYSPAHVKSGALAAIFISPEKIGIQLAELVSKVLINKAFKMKPYYFASDFDVTINRSVARSLNLELPEEQFISDQIREAESR